MHHRLTNKLFGLNSNNSFVWILLRKFTEIDCQKK